MNYLALGDSISIDDYTEVPNGGAASQFARLIEAKQFQNLTRDGRTTAGILEAWNEITLMPDVVTLTAGGNDFLQGTWQALNTPAGWGYVSSQPLANLEKIADHLAAFDCAVILNTVYDPSDGDDALLGLFGLGTSVTAQSRKSYNTLNNGIRELAHRHGFLLSDLETLFHGHGFASPDTWIVGQIEPNLFGATAIARHWLKLYNVKS